MRLIDADALIENIIESIPDLRKFSTKTVGEVIDNTPTVDAVPVIRCKDCKWYKTNYSWDGKEHRVCVIEAYEPVRKADDFCSRAERKEE